MPRGNGADRRRFGDLLQRVSLHLEICPRVDLSCLDIDVPEEVSNHVERDSALQQVHSFGVSQRVRGDYSVQTWALASGSEEVFLKDVADSRTRESLMTRVLEERLVELLGTIQAILLYVPTQKSLYAYKTAPGN